VYHSRKILVTILSSLLLLSVKSQDNYEIQVYGSSTQAKGSAIFELHSNYFINGIKESSNGVYPTHHAVHKTIEITQGLSDIAELGFYLFTNFTPSHGYHFVGIHIRPRIRAPDRWDLPVGLSLSAEFGWQKPEYSEDTWNIELRPIIDKQWKDFYVSFNPTFGFALKSPYSNAVPSFEPSLKMNYRVFTHGALGMEYYGGMGQVTHFDKWAEQGHTLYVAYDMLDNVNWEFNAGLGFGLTPATDKLVAKVILGRRITWGKKKLAVIRVDQNLVHPKYKNRGDHERAEITLRTASAITMPAHVLRGHIAQDKVMNTLFPTAKASPMSFARITFSPTCTSTS